MSLPTKQNYRLPFIIALALHSILILALLINFKFRHAVNAAAESPNVNIINAVAVTQSQLPSQQQTAQQQKPQPQQTEQQPVEQKPLKEKTQEQKSVEQKPEPQQPTHLAEENIKQKQLAAEKQQQLVIKQMAEQKMAEEALAEKKQQEQIEKRKKAAEQKKLLMEQLQHELAEQQKQEEKQAKDKQVAEAKKTAEQVAKQLMQQELAATDKASNTAKVEKASSSLSAAEQGKIDKYKTLIIQAISQQWIVPDNLKKGLEAKLLVKLAPGGMVVSVSLIKSSGDSVLDRSAQTAVYKASPLPVPPDNSLFDEFRIINLTVRPEGIMAG